MKPLAIDLFCGLGGWTEGLLAEGYYVVGFDIEQHVYGEHRYPAQFVIQDVLTLHGKQFKDAALIVASPPCQEYSYMAMPWTRAKERARQYRAGELNVKDLTALFDAAVRIGHEAGVPTVIENVRGAIPWVGRSRWNFGSYHLWGDVPALMPMTKAIKVPSFRFDGSGRSFQTASVETTGTKNPGMSWSGSDKPGYKAVAFNDQSIKNAGGSWFRMSHNNVPHSRGDAIKHTPHMNNPAEHIKCGGDWFGPGENMSAMRHMGSKSSKRKMASAMIAKIPLPLSRHIARTFYPASQSAKTGVK
jgi:hypothetical protein